VRSKFFGGQVRLYCWLADEEAPYYGEWWEKGEMLRIDGSDEESYEIQLICERLVAQITLLRKQQLSHESICIDWEHLTRMSIWISLKYLNQLSIWINREYLNQFWVFESIEYLNQSRVFESI
jgi:hypothetical protein